MGRIKKVATERHTATASPFVSRFVEQATSTPLHHLPSKLDTFPLHWPFPRGDLYHWIPLLDRFDHILELFNAEYGLAKGPQQEQFESRLLQKGDAEDGMPYPAGGAQEDELQKLGYSSEGDREVIESVVHFTRIILEHCGNRSLYNSSGQLDDLLNTTSLSLLRLVLRLGVRLAQRYQVARYKNSAPHAQLTLLANHYNFKLDRLQKIAQPFPKPAQAASSSIVAVGKGKEKAAQTAPYNPSDLVAIAKEPQTLNAKGDVAGIHFTYYDQSAAAKDGSSNQPNDAPPPTPTPIRRTSTLGPSRDRPGIGERSATTGDVNATPTKPREVDTAPSSASKTFQISGTNVAETPAWALVKEAMSEVPSESSFDMLHRIRIAKALVHPEDTSQELLEVRLLAIANLAYALAESKFMEKIGIPDSEEPKRFHLAQQLCDLLRPATGSQAALSLQMETAVLLTLEALSKSRSKSSEVSDALQISHNHGVIYYELRRVIATLHSSPHEDSTLELREIEWREAVFDLTNTLLQSNTQARHGERMVNAGIMEILLEALTLRTSRAERFNEKILQFFDSFIHGITTSFQTLVDAKGLDELAELMSYEVTSSLQNAKDGRGLPAEYKSKVVDYDIPFYQQSTLRQLFKFMVHMFEHNAGTHDRLLRNLVDTPQVLGALRNVIENASVFGSNVWSGAVNIMSSFIHNEPTSFQVVGEAGLVKSLLQTIVPWDLSEDDSKPRVVPEAFEYKDGELQYPSPTGILPVGETMCDIPTAFGAICLNESGMQLFQSSKALMKFMDIFVSPPHVRALEEEGQTASTIGQAFDELSRHHPRLKGEIMSTVIAMVKRVNELCRYLAEQKGHGTKLWENTSAGVVVSGGRKALAGLKHATESTTISSSDVVTAEGLNEDDKDRVSGVPFVSACFKFLEGFFLNAGMCSLFCEEGGAVHLLDLAVSASNPYDIVAFPPFGKIASVIKSMCEAKPHLVLPTLIHHTQTAIKCVKPIIDSDNSERAFAAFMDLSKPQASPPFSPQSNGTTVAKALAMVHMLTHLFGRALAPPAYPGVRNQHPSNQLFVLLNFTDIYVELVDDLGLLHAACVWENLALQQDLSDDWNQQTDPKPFAMRRVDVNGFVEISSELRSENPQNGQDANGTTRTKAESREETFSIKNAKTIRYLLSQAPVGIESFFQSLAQAIVPKRGHESGTRQHAFIVAEHLAHALVQEFTYKKFDPVNELLEAKARAHAVTVCTRVLLRNANLAESFVSKETMTLVLNKFYLAGGFERLNECLRRFGELALEHAKQGDALYLTSLDTLSSILNLYSQVVRGKVIHESPQSSSISVRNHEQADYFMPGQFVVEIRNAILPAVNELWHSGSLEHVTDNHVKSVVEILRIILKSEGEDRALSRSVNAARRIQTTKLEFKLKNTEDVRSLKSSGYDESLAREALFRCNGHVASAHEYCHLRQQLDTTPAFPIPQGEATAPNGSQSASAETSRATDTSSAEQSTQPPGSVEMADAAGDQPANAQDAPDPEDVSIFSEDPDVMSDDPFGLSVLPDEIQEADLMAMVGQNSRLRNLLRLANGNALPTTSTKDASSKEEREPFTTVEDLDEKRDALRGDLLDRSLELLSAQPTISFELAELIQAAVAKSGEGASPRADIGSTLVSSLLSLQGDEPSEETGAKIAAYAHLVALILQDRDFFDSTLDELKENFDALISWIQPGFFDKVENAPWIEMILLIIERILVEDEQPTEIQWTTPNVEDPLKPLPEPTIPEPVISFDLKSTLFEAVVELLPKVGKNASLALSINRVLVILTRRRELAARLREKLNLSKLFVMIKQLAGSVNEKLQSSFMIILRHMVEDDAILREIMKTEISSVLEAQRVQRPMDTTSYARTLYHLVLRDPNLFVEVTKEMVEIVKYDHRPERGQVLALKAKTPPPAENGNANATASDPAAQPSVEESSANAQALTELKPPVVETTDGVVQFLLRELSNYKDVEDKQNAPANASAANGSSGDVDMSDETSPNSGSTVPKKDDEPPSFKAEEHVIYIYRCFIMQCLTELLASYNCCKAEFINFSRKPEAQTATPSKPRSGTINYLLNVLMPVGTLEHRDDITHRKKASTAHWATTVLIALCSQTPQLTKTEEPDPTLYFVRRFVLEHALRAFKEATTSNEPLDQRYSRLLALGELFSRMLSNKLNATNPASADGFSAQRMGRFMYEKNFISALTSAIAEIDLNFPNAKRAVKYLLGPLRLLTEMGVTLSQYSDFSSSAGATTDGEEISSATSISDVDEEEEDREQTPDLYRNSTLGLFESGAGRGHESESESGEDDEEEMYDDGYDDEDGMDFEEGPMPDHDEVVSDEDDEDIDGMGEIEGVPGDVDFEMDVVMAGDDDGETISEDSQDDDEEREEDDDEDDDDDDHHHGDFVDEMDEITGDDENASMPDHPEEHDWDEDDGAIFETAVIEEGGSPHGGPLQHFEDIMNNIPPRADLDPRIRIETIRDGEEEYFDDEMPPEDEEDDEDEEIDLENDVVYEPGLEDDDDDEDGDNELQWDMRPAIPLPHVRAAVQQHHHHHHHHHRHGLQDMFGMMANDAMRIPPFRGHRAPANARGEEDGTNPLLQRDGNSSGGNGRGDAYVGSTFVRGGRHTLYTRHGDTFFQDLVATVGANGRAIVDVNIGDAPQRGVDLATSPWERRQVLHALLDLDPARPWREQIRIPQWPDMPGTHRSHDPRSSSYSDEAQAVEFRPTATAARWQEEARMLFSGKHQEKATRIIPSLLRVLIPPAMEAKRMQEKADAEKRAAALEKAREDEKKKAEEKAEREKAEREERETREAEEARAREDAALAASLAGEGPAEATMEDVTPSQPALPTSEGAQEATTTEPAATPRVTTTIRGRELDITSLGIDLTYLEELPEELREEVIMGQFAQQRSQAAEAGEQPSEISREFLEALPPDIQRELLRQEASERRHRQQQEQRRRSAQEGNAPPAQPEEMNNADFMAMLEPELRQQILADADENTLAALPEDAQAEARTLGERRLPRADQLARLGRFAEGDPRTRLLHRGQAEQAVRDAASRQRRPVIQMLDKAGIATLLRLMFVSLHHKAKSNLHSILSDVCKNTQNRAEVISILLSILQDGTADVAAVERSFAQLSLRAKHQSAQKTPTPLKRTVTGTIITPGAELSPLNIVQQCLGTLNALTLDNPRVPSFFLTEHETVTSQKAKPGKKGKGREVRAAKFPLNSLLTLLDRKLITENTGVMEALAALLSRVTHPLIILLRKAMREAEDATKATEEASAAEQEDRPSTSGTDVDMAEAANVDVGANEGAAQAASSTAAAEGVSIEEKPAGADDAEAPKTDTGKKHREMVPPEVPEENIRLVVNIITARECPGKTFTETLDVIKNLSALPGARETFGKELVSQAQELSQAVLLDLEDLAKQINAAQTGTDLQGMALTNFSSAASMQHKLLRVLVALDHLFDPTQTPSISSKGSLATDPSLKEDILAGLYESATFDKLWGNLSQCLTAIRNRGNMINVAAVLLPIIESLMVVCRNSALKDSVDAVATQQASVGTPQPDARLDSLFFRFTEEHRKILNELIRNNPKLMNGNLAVLAKNSKVLEFDNKRSYFTRKVHVRPANDGRIAHPSLQLNVRRDQVFLDSFKSLYYKSGTEIKYGKLNIRFHGEEGVDAGGVSREWFAAMARQMFNPDYALFIPVASDKTTFHPNQFSAVNHEHLMFFKFIGRIIGKALYEGRVLDCHFSRAVYRRILGKSVSLKDMESLDLEYYKSLVWILENDITDVTFETFSIDVDKFGLVETVDLVPDGHNIAVTEENKQEYVRLVVEHRLVKSVEEQLEHFLAGFHDIIPPELIAIFNEQELELLISGLPEIDVDDWKNNTDYHNYQPTSPQIQWFWRAVRSFDKEERAKLLQFVTGTSKVPLNGFKELEGMNGFSKFNIHRDYSSKEKLPSSHTCFNQLDLPEYESYEHLRQQLYTAITAGSEYFGFA